MGVERGGDFPRSQAGDPRRREGPFPARERSDLRPALSRLKSQPGPLKLANPESLRLVSTRLPGHYPAPGTNSSSGLQPSSKTPQKSTSLLDVLGAPKEAAATRQPRQAR
ncbi:unnamed protein product [Rangifer tarandus platyrhynchus]|uniref:Uncharacterized protein n=2 Tax=Rangifer tarandus platyrhynchus TaxID=3082113 RepID=A0ACB0DSF6_RANTA|nr:unnamed protein product [Rangifer tarandus platyrhynchus]CAI9691183.1 unnamed protein product [Rangifer tarandus platyrhynchus]